MNCFCGMVDWWKMFSLISSWDHCQRSSPSWISNTLWAGFEPAQNLSSGFVELSCAVVITTTHSIATKNKIHKINTHRHTKISFLGFSSSFLLHHCFCIWKLFSKALQLSEALSEASQQPNPNYDTLRLNILYDFWEIIFIDIPINTFYFFLNKDWL